MKPEAQNGSVGLLMTVGLLTLVMVALPVVAIIVSIVLLLTGVWTWPF